MNDPVSSRSLLLEQLESRCMLAAGLLDHSFSRDNQIGDRFSAADRNTGRADIVGQQRAGHQHPGQQHAGHQHAGRQEDGRSRSGQHTLGNVPNRSPAKIGTESNRPAASLQVVVTISTPDPVRTAIAIPAISNPSDTGSRDSVPSSQPASTARLTPAAQPSSSSSETATASVFVARVDRATPAEAESTQSSATQGSATTERASGRLDVVIDDAAVARVDADVTNAIFSLGSARSAASDFAQTGELIETLPLLRRELRLDSEQYRHSDVDDAWQLDSDVLGRLRETANDRANPSNSIHVDDIAQQIDSVLDSWFSDSMGLIDLSSEGHPFPHQDDASSIVNVVLNATVGIHRSVELIAETDRPTVPDDVRVAILAAIAAEQPQLGEPALPAPQQRVSAAMYPGAALIASTLAVANLRRKQAKLESTK